MDDDERDRLLADAVAATLAKRAADAAAVEALRSRRVAVWRLYREAGLSGPGIARELKARLIAAGIDDGQVRGLGVGHDSIRTIVEGPDPT